MTETVTPPLLWPLPAEAMDQARPIEGGIVAHTLARSQALMGLVTDLDAEGVRTLRSTFEASQRPDNGMLIVVLYPACPTRQEHLEQLVTLAARTKGLEVRILAEDGPRVRPTVLLPLAGEGKQPLGLIVAGSPNLGEAAIGLHDLNLFLQPDSLLISSFIRWFDYAFARAVPLTLETAAIPMLVPASGSPEAAEMWRAYCSLCAAPTISIDIATGDVLVTDADGVPIQTASATLGLPPSDLLAERVAAIICRGSQVILATGSAVPPLSVPIAPATFGLAAERSEGQVTQRQSFSLTVFSDDEQRELEKFRKGSRSVLDRLGLPMSKGITWLPDSAIPLFEAEVHAINIAARAKINLLVAGDVRGFIAKRRATIERDLASMARALGAPPPERGLIERLMEELARRLDVTETGRQFTTPASFNKVQVDLAKDGGARSAWAQPATLLLALAKFPREVLSKPSRLKGLQSPAADVSSALNVANDIVLRDRVAQRAAKADLGLLESIAEYDGPDRNKAAAALAIIDGQAHAEVIEILNLSPA